MSRRCATQLCTRKHPYGTRAEAEAVIARWVTEGTLRYPVRVYACPLEPATFHIGRAKGRRP